MTRIISILLCAFLITACAAPPTPPLPAGEGQGVKETPAPTLTETITPSPAPTSTPTATPEPTATATPEAREFVPANDIEFVEELLDYNLRLAPDADRDAIYWDIIVSHLGDVISKSKGMEANRAVYEEIVKDHPEWNGIGNGWDYKVRVEFMKEFLARTGGRMIVTDMNFKKYEANFNEEIKFEVVQVAELPNGFLPELPRNDSDSVGKGAGTGIYVNDEGQVVYSVAIVGDTLGYTLKEDERSIFNTTNWTEGEVVSELFRNLIASTAVHSRADYKVIPATNHKLYVRGSDPDDQGYFLDITSTFIK